MGDPWKSINEEGVRAFTYGSLSVMLVWFSTAGYLSIFTDILMMVGLSALLAKSIFISTVIFLLVITIFYGLHGKIFTTLILEHMTWVKNPDKYLIFFFIWLNLIAACLLNVFELNKFFQFVSLFVVFLFPSLILGIGIQKKGGNI
ncbi:MAG: hypothetical protein ACJ0QT_02755 [Gammaproteobacteria bacterium]|tara:strand:+ start:15009 stop:15446 length:438 start_codon:yes stop_codon:yes gene_type:complete